MQVNAARLRANLEQLATFGREADGGITRPALSEADIQARRWYADLARQAGLAVTVDGLFNVTARLGSSGKAAVWSGSHLDSVPHGGMFDGALGAMAALECVRRLREESVPLRHPVAAAAFCDEEGAFHGFLGSKGLAHGWTEPELRAMHNSEGASVIDALARWHVDPARATATTLGPGAVHAFVELHIEQGPVLEDNATNIGIVTGIVGINNGVFTFTGRPDHAGTTPMHLRRDALRGAAAFLDRLPALPGKHGSPTSVATCGQLHVAPGANNVVPSSAVVHVDFRDQDPEALRRLEAAMLDTARECAASHDLGLEYTLESSTAPIAMDAALADISERAARKLGLSTRRMPSGAGHDTQVMAALAPAGMIFVPSRDGRSHSALESTSWDDIANGANVLLNTLLDMANRPS